MAKNRYDIVTHTVPGRELPPPVLRIVKYRIGITVDHWFLDRRLSKFWLVYWNETPGATLSFCDQRVTLTPGILILIPPYTLVSAEVSAPFVHNFIEFTAGAPFEAPRLSPICFHTREILPPIRDPKDKTRLALSLYSLIQRLLLTLPVNTSEQQNSLNIDPRIRHSLEQLDTLAPCQYSAENLSRHANLSPSRFLHLFKEQTGITPRTYLLQKRLEQVWQLLENSTLSIPEIAEQTGFVDRSHLSRVFKASTGQTPVQIRHKHP